MKKGTPAARHPCRVLLLAPFFPPHRNSEAHATGRFALALLRAGFDLKIISSAPTGSVQGASAEGLGWEELRPVTAVLPRAPLGRGGVAAARLRGLAATRQIVSNLSWVSLALDEAHHLAERWRPDAILSRSQPISGHLPALVLSRRLGVPWVANWNDIEPGHRSPSPYGQGPTAPMSAGFQRCLSTIVEGAHHHTFCAERSLRYMASWAPELIGKSSVIPHVALDSPPWPHVAPSQADHFRLCHAGTFDGRRDPTRLFAALDRFLSARSYRAPFRLVLLGNNYEGTVTFPIPESVRPFVEIQPWKSYDKAREEMARATVLLALEADVAEGIFLPNKFVEYVECGRPVLAISPQEGTLHDFLGAFGGGVCCDVRSADSILTGIESLYMEWKTGTLEKERDPMRLRAQFSEGVVVTALKNVFDSLRVGGDFSG